MLHLEVDEFSEGLSTWLGEAEVALVEAYRGFTVSVFHSLVMETPQWTGNAVCAWNFGVGSPVAPGAEQTSKIQAYMNLSYPEKMLFNPFSKGAGGAVNVADALARNAGRDMRVTLQTPVFFTNAAADLDDAVYIRKLEENPGGDFLRPENRPGHMVERTASHFGNLGVLPPTQLAGLRGVRLDNVATTSFLGLA